jgi:hypothetical protein
MLRLALASGARLSAVSIGATDPREPCRVPPPPTCPACKIAFQLSAFVYDFQID